MCLEPVIGRAFRSARNEPVAATLTACAPRFALPKPAILAVRVKRLFAGPGQDWLVKRTDCGHSDGCCLLLAQALKALLPGSRVVTMMGARTRGVSPDHYGVLWRGWYFDGSGGFPGAAAWIDYFKAANYISCPTVEDRYVRSPDIPNQSWYRAELIAFLKEGLRSR